MCRFNAISAMRVVKDPSSVAEPADCVNKHIDLDWEVDFQACEIRGTATITFDRRPAAQVALLDVEKLDIKRTYVRLKKTDPWIEVTAISEPFASFGSLLRLPLPPVEHENGGGMQEVQAKLEYATDRESPSVCWLEEAQTAGKQHKYLFTQGQSVLNRSLFPCQDSPAIRITYSASVRVPPGYTALMSAAAVSPPGGEEVTDASGRVWRRFAYEMRQSIPSYLVALVVGHLASAPIGPRSKVWTEPEMLEACRREFEGITERYLAVGEELFGPYLWEEYDLCVMPPGFPFGGMENPRLTFVTATLVVGDKSLTDTIAHEIAHSWTGNLVTNGTWGDFWINEGFTMYAQRRITSVVHGEAYTHLEAIAGKTLLRQEIHNLGADSPLTRLRVPMEDGADPEDTYTDIPYEKGYAFVAYLRHLVGSDQAFDAWLKAYVSSFAFKTVMSEDVFEHFLAHFPELTQQDVHNRPGFEFESCWLHSPGFPPFFPELTAASSLTDPADALIAELKQGSVRPENAMAGWPTYQKTYLLDTLLEDDTTFSTQEGQATLLEMARCWGVGESQNGEVAMRWAQLVAKNGLVQALPQVERFLGSQGRQKNTLAVYRALMEGKDPAFQDFAHRVFAATKRNLHVNVVKYVSRILAGEADGDA